MPTGHSINKNWRPLPRYILRKYNLLKRIKSFNDCRSFIDIGCGAGDLACSTANLGMHGKGYDFSPQAIEIARQRKKNSKKFRKEKVDFCVSDVDISDMEEKADLVLCMEVLEHIKNDKEVFSSLVSLARKRIIISVPAKQKLYGHSDELAGHYRRYDYEDLMQLVDHPSVRIDEIISYGYPFTNISRFFLERGAKKQKAKLNKDAGSKEELSKNSGVHIFNLSWLAKRLPFEVIMWPAYHFSRLFNYTNLSEGYIVILSKNTD